MTESPSSSLRIMSLIPSATEIVAALGLTDYLVGRSHECDFPDTVKSLPVCTEPKFNPEGTSAEIHDRVTEILQHGLSVYRIKTDVLQQLQPTHILTQAQCEVCAVSLQDVEIAVGTLTGFQPQIISLEPRVLADLWADIERVATALGVSATAAITALKQQLEDCQTLTESLPERDRPTVACIEWIDPLMAAGNWMPELVQLAGGRSVFGNVGQQSLWLQWQALVQADPEIIVILPCGFDLKRTQEEAQLLRQHSDWSSLTAVQTDRVYLTDGNAYFNRPGPRLVNSVELLAELFHPSRCQFGYEGIGWSLFE